MKNTKVEKEIMAAYADCWMDGEAGYKRRNLQFKSNTFVSLPDAKRIVAKAIPQGYNEFNAAVLDKFPDYAKFKIAREGSPCLYVKGRLLPNRECVGADEMNDQSDGTTRFWWD